MKIEEVKKRLEKETDDERIKVAFVILLILTIAFISSIFVWLWHSWDLAWKIALTSIISYVIFGIFHELWKKMNKEVIEKLMADHKEDKPKSFQERLKEKMAEQTGKTKI